MLGKIIFGIATVCFLTSLGVGTVSLGDSNSLNGLATFIYTLRYGTAGVFSATSVSNFVIHFVALVATGANFVFIFWAMLVFSPTRITSLKWFWWLSLLFLLAAVYTGVQVLLDDRISLQQGYVLWVASLVLMLLAPVVSRYERKRKERNSQVLKLTNQSAPESIKKQSEPEEVV